MVDTDGDKDLDLLIGTSSGHVVHVLNAGTPRNAKFTVATLLRAGNDPLRVGGNASPCTGDWNGDEAWDLVVGACDGSVTLFANTGSDAKPSLAAGETLIERAPWSLEGAFFGDTPRSGAYARPVIVDYDGDGRRDLLVGDTEAFDRATRLDPQRHAERLQLVARRDELGDELARLLPVDPKRSNRAVTLSPEQSARFMAASVEAQQIRERIAELEKHALPASEREPETGGNVWVYPRPTLPWRNARGKALLDGQKKAGG